MNGLLIDADLPDGVKLEQTEKEAWITVPERGMFEALMPIRILLPGVKLRIRAGATSRARFVIDYEFDAALEAVFELDSGAFMDVFHLDYQERDKKLTARNFYSLKKHASLNVWTFASGSSAEIRHELKFLEPHGFASLRGLSLLGDSTDVTHVVTVDHAAGYCASRQFYKTILADKARSAFESLVIVAKGAEKSDSRQLNKNLLLSKDAVAVSRPELRISADDVACAHGSATGELREEELFYLRSRGIREQAARFMMTEGFASEVLEEVPQPELREELQALVKDRILQLVRL